MASPADEPPRPARMTTEEFDLQTALAMSASEAEMQAARAKEVEVAHSLQRSRRESAERIAQRSGGLKKRALP